MCHTVQTLYTCTHTITIKTPCAERLHHDRAGYAAGRPYNGGCARYLDERDGGKGESVVVSGGRCGACVNRERVRGMRKVKKEVGQEKRPQDGEVGQHGGGGNKGKEVVSEREVQQKSKGRQDEIAWRGIDDKGDERDGVWGFPISAMEKVCVREEEDDAEEEETRLKELLENLANQPRKHSVFMEEAEQEARIQTKKASQQEKMGMGKGRKLAAGTERGVF